MALIIIGLIMGIQKRQNFLSSGLLMGGFASNVITHLRYGNYIAYSNRNKLYKYSRSNDSYRNGTRATRYPIS